MRSVALSLIALSAAGCGSSFDPITLLDSPRILAVVADPPEVASGQASSLRAIHFPGDSATFSWAYCTEVPVPGTSTVARDCLDNDTADYLYPLPAGETTSITMPAESFSSLGLPDATDGLYLPVRVKMTAAYDGGAAQTVTGIYGLRWHPPLPTAANKNPTFMGLYLVPSDGSSPPDAGATGTMPFDDTTVVTMKAGDKQTLRAIVTPESAETYLVIDDPAKMTTRTLTETVSVQWYADAGSWSVDATGSDRPDTDFTLDDKHLPTGAAIHLFAIARDERGGTAVLQRSIQYQK